jgi:hypothetical protein
MKTYRTAALLAVSLAITGCSRHRISPARLMTSATLSVIEELAVRGANTASPNFVVVDAASLHDVVHLTPSNIAALRVRLGDRAGVGIASAERECRYSRGRPCARLVIRRFEARDGTVRVRAVWLPPEREGQRCVHSYEATFVFLTHPSGVASLIEIDEEDYGSCGSTGSAPRT